MAKDSDILQAVRDRDIPALSKLLAKSSRHKAKHGSAAKKLNVNYQDNEGMSALHQASLQGDESCMTLLLDAGALTDVKDNRGMRPLHYAAWQGLLEPVRMLLDCGSAVNESAEDGETPLHLACQHGHLDVVRLLLRHGADPAVRNKSKRSPLDLACEFGKAKVVEHLIQSHLCDQILLMPSSCDFADSNETTCLHLASKNGHANIVQLLLSSGVDINWQTAQGTALHEAALCGKTNVVRLLIQHGVDVNISNSFDQTALDVVDKFTTRAAAKELKTLLHEASSSLLARAVKDYGSAYDKSILPLKAGDLVTILERRSDGFWKGFLTETGSSSSGAGFFPSDCVVVLATGARGPLEGGPAGADAGAASADGRSASSLSSTGSLGHQHTNGHLFEQRYGGSGGGTSASGEDDDCPAVYPPLWASSSSSAGPLFPGESTVTSPGGSCQLPAAFPHQQPRDVGLTNGQLPGHVVPQCGGSLSGGAAGAAAARDARGSSSRTVTGTSSTCRPPSLQSGHSFDGSESVLSGGYGGVASRRSVRSDDGLLGGGPMSGGDTCSSISAGSSEHLMAAATSDRRGVGEDYSGCYEDDWESGYASCSFNPAQLLQQGAKDAEVLRAWIGEMHFDGYSYVDNFLQAGYDLPTVSRMTPEDLTAIGITVPAHRRKLTGEIARLNIGDGLPDFKPASVMEWLQLLRLEQYHDCLVADGYSSVAALTDITWEDLEQIGIKKLGHQKKVMLAIEQLKKVGKRLSCSSQSSCGSEVPAAIAAGVAPGSSKQQQAGRKIAPELSLGATPSRSRVHHRSVSGEMVQSIDGYACVGQRSASRQLSCDSAMTRSLMLQQTYQPSATANMPNVSRSSSGNSVSTCAAAAAGAVDYSQLPQRTLSFSRPDDCASVNSSEDSASSVSSCGSHQAQQHQTRRQPAYPADMLTHPAAGGRAMDKHRHASASSGGGGCGSFEGGSPPQYSTLVRQAHGSGSSSGGMRCHRTASTEESPYAEPPQRFPSREATPPLAAVGSPINPHCSPFAEFRSPYAAIQNGCTRRVAGFNAAGGPAASPPRHGGGEPLSQHQLAVPSSSSHKIRHHLPVSYAQDLALATERGLPGGGCLAEEAGGNSCDPDSASSSSSECELDGQDFPPAAPPIAFDMQHMRVHKQPRTMPQLPAVAERRLAAAAAAASPQALLGRSVAKRDGEARAASGGSGSESGSTPTTSRRDVGSSRMPPPVSAAEAYAAGTLPFANENAGTIRQRPPSCSSSSTCSSGDGSSTGGRQATEWDGGSTTAGDGASTAASGPQRRALRPPLELNSYDGMADDARRSMRPVMHVQPVVVSEQRYSSPALPALSALQRHIFEGDDDLKEKEHLQGVECAAGLTSLGAIQEHDNDA